MSDPAGLPVDPLEPVDPFDAQLRARLERLALAMPVDPPPSRDRSRARRPRSWRVALVAGVLLLVVSIGAGAALIEIGHPAQSSSAFAAGGPLHCSGVDQLSPQAAASWLIAHGLTPHWQLEDRAAATFTHNGAIPDHGVIVDALVLEDGHILLLVDTSRDTPPPARSCP